MRSKLFWGLAVLSSAAPDAAFVPKRAREAAQLAASVYYPRSEILAWNCSACTAFAASGDQGGGGPTALKLLTNAKYGLQAFVGDIDGGTTAVVSIRGTVDSDWHTWLDDASIAFTEPWSNTAGGAYAGVKTHTGFTRCFQAIEPDVLAALQGLGVGAGAGKIEAGSGGRSNGQRKRLMLVGHSSGASVAALLAFDLAVTHGIAVDELWSLGQPRTGDAGWRDAAGALLGAAPGAVSWRVTHAKDIIPHVPYEWMKYVHVGNSTREVWYNEPSSAWELCDGSGEDAQCSDSCGDDCLSVSDHLLYLNVSIP